MTTGSKGSISDIAAIDTDFNSEREVRKWPDDAYAVRANLLAQHC
jgi:hypothetical protein